MSKTRNKLPDITEDIDGDTIFYEGNPQLKGSGYKLPYTIDHIEEYKKCKEDIFYFAENYYYILDLDKGMIKIQLRDYQKDMIKSFVENRNTIVLASRQVGKCVSPSTHITIRGKESGRVVKLSMEELHQACRVVGKNGEKIIDFVERKKESLG